MKNNVLKINYTLYVKNKEVILWMKIKLISIG